MNYLKDLGNESMEMKSDLFSVVKKYKVYIEFDKNALNLYFSLLRIKLCIVY